jgi:NDP-sugar pyrophosphorylase family protein
MQVHRDIMDGKYRAAPFDGRAASVAVSPQARVDDSVVLEGPCFVDEGAVIKSGAQIKPYSVIGRQCYLEEQAVVDRAIIWANTRIGQSAVVRRSVLGRHCHVGRSAVVEEGVVLGDKSVITDYSRL